MKEEMNSLNYGITRDPITRSIRGKESIRHRYDTLRDAVITKAKADCEAKTCIRRRLVKSVEIITRIMQV